MSDFTSRAANRIAYMTDRQFNVLIGGLWLFVIAFYAFLFHTGANVYQALAAGDTGRATYYGALVLFQVAAGHKMSGAFGAATRRLTGVSEFQVSPGFPRESVVPHADIMRVTARHTYPGGETVNTVHVRTVYGLTEAHAQRRAARWIETHS